ncbi:RNA-directed DNA polymerase from mobile element jockey [Trichonephila clavipes]|nr:RNA-directed DNA polymerase from mobile element jockey [Trichonephila clavipes]
MVLNFPISIIFQLTNLINKILHSGHFPQAWKTATVIPILKPGKDPTLATSHRPISLLPVLSKLAERIILNRLNDHLQQNDILIPQQHGFRAKIFPHRTNFCVWLNMSKPDLRKTSQLGLFSSIYRKLSTESGTMAYSINSSVLTPPYLIKIIKSFLENRNFSVLVNHSYSPLKNISAGVPQGALLSSTLFNIYVNDIPRTSFSTICLYADDTAILVQNANLQIIAHQLHKHLARLEHWLSIWKIALNVEKTEAVFFSHHIKKKSPNIYIQNKHIPWSQSTKYLGVTLDKRLTFRQHLIQLRKNFRISVAKIYPLISRNSFFFISQKQIAYLYANFKTHPDLRLPNLGSCSPLQHINQIEIAQNL